jgi:hypothetical protein
MSVDSASICEKIFNHASMHDDDKCKFQESIRANITRQAPQMTEGRKKITTDIFCIAMSVFNLLFKRGEMNGPMYQAIVKTLIENPNGDQLYFFQQSKLSTHNLKILKEDQAIEEAQSKNGGLAQIVAKSQKEIDRREQKKRKTHREAGATKDLYDINISRENDGDNEEPSYRRTLEDHVRGQLMRTTRCVNGKLRYGNHPFTNDDDKYSTNGPVNHSNVPVDDPQIFSGEKLCDRVVNDFEPKDDWTKSKNNLSALVRATVQRNAERDAQRDAQEPDEKNEKLVVDHDDAHPMDDSEKPFFEPKHSSRHGRQMACSREATFRRKRAKATADLAAQQVEEYEEAGRLIARQAIGMYWRWVAEVGLVVSWR